MDIFDRRMASMTLRKGVGKVANLAEICLGFVVPFWNESDYRKVDPNNSSSNHMKRELFSRHFVFFSKPTDFCINILA